MKQRPPQPMRSSGFTNPDFARLAELAHVLAGLVFPPNRQPSAEAGMRRAMATLHISDPAALLRAAERPGDGRDVVLAELTVGESYFFRDAAQLEPLSSEILPRLANAEYQGRRPSVWSAGCATGEEPYTVAIMLRELGWPHPARILGTDIALPRLEAARRGRYTRWALRGVSEERIDKWFHRAGNHFQLEPAVRESVEFRPFNLVRDDYGLIGAGAGFDLVLCRNVMIYFDVPTITRIATGLLAALAPDGWLVLGASDPPLFDLVPCEVVMGAGGIAYRRAGRPGASPRKMYSSSESLRAVTAPLPSAPEVAVTIALPVRSGVTPLQQALPPLRAVASSVEVAVCDDDELLRAYARSDYPAVEALAIRGLASSAEDEKCLSLWIHYVRAVANQGRLHDAGELCARAIELHPLAPELHYLHGTLLAEAGWQADAAIAARRSLYLDRRFVMGYMLLGDALTRADDVAGARIAFENVRELLAVADADAAIPAADGVPASRLRQVALLRLRSLATAKR